MRYDVLERVKRFVIDEIKPNYSEVARQLEVDPRTVKAAYQRALNGTEKRKAKKKRKSKLDGFRDLIEVKYQAGCSARAIFDFICEKGFQGKYTIVKDYCRQYKKKEVKKATTRVEHTIGLSAQVDWKEKVLMHDKNNVEHIFSIFLYVLPYSKRKFIKLTLDQKQDTLFECLTEAFHFMNGVPKEIWFDNMSTVVDHQTSTFNHHHFNDHFLSFSHDAGFHPIACRPFRPQTKGCVEALARTMSRLKPYDKEFETLNDLENLINDLCIRLNHEKSQGNNKVPEKEWEKEKEHLQPINPDLTRYFSSVQTRKVSKDAMIRFRNHQYSVPLDYIGKEVQIKVTEDQKSVHIFFKGVEIRSHNVSDKQFTYNTQDQITVLRSDLMKNASEKEINEYMNKDLSVYDNL